MSIGSRIKEALAKKGMTQKELAEKTRFTEVTISRYISDNRTPDAKAIKSLCRVLGVSADWLLGNDEKKESCEGCKYCHKLKHNFTSTKGFQDSLVCDVWFHLEHKQEPYFYEVSQRDRCEMFEGGKR